jgi:hypothetical protein
LPFLKTRLPDGTIPVELEVYTPDIEECRFLFFKLIEQAVKDYSTIKWTDTSYRDFHWQTAYAFIFDDTYFISWGDLELNLSTICDYLDIDIEWLRMKTRAMYTQTEEEAK